jgi:hypothetical protein
MEELEAHDSLSDRQNDICRHANGVGPAVAGMLGMYSGAAVVARLPVSSFEMPSQGCGLIERICKTATTADGLQTSQCTAHAQNMHALLRCLPFDIVSFVDVLEQVTVNSLQVGYIEYPRERLLYQLQGSLRYTVRFEAVQYFLPANPGNVSENRRTRINVRVGTHRRNYTPGGRDLISAPARSTEISPSIYLFQISGAFGLGFSPSRRTLTTAV